MDSTLVQIIDQWLLSQAEVKRLSDENAQLRAEVVSLRKPKVAIQPTPEHSA